MVGYGRAFPFLVFVASAVCFLRCIDSRLSYCGALRFGGSFLLFWFVGHFLFTNMENRGKAGIIVPGLVFMWPSVRM